MSLDTITSLTDLEEESIDALILRYSQCVSMIQDQIFRGIAYLEQEDIGDKSNRDKALKIRHYTSVESPYAHGAWSCKPSQGAWQLIHLNAQKCTLSGKCSFFHDDLNAAIWSRLVNSKCDHSTRMANTDVNHNSAHR